MTLSNSLKSLVNPRATDGEQNTVNNHNDAALLLADVRAGNQSAAHDLFHLFANRLVGLARKRLDFDLRAKIDPEDIVQSVFGSFFRRNDAGEINIESWESLWSLLAIITAHKCGHQIRYFRAAKRSAGLEIPSVEYTEDSSVHWDAIARDPSPSDAVMLTEAVEEMMRPLSDRERDIVTLSLQGYDVGEIAAKVERSERTVRRLLQQVRDELESRCVSSES